MNYTVPRYLKNDNEISCFVVVEPAKHFTMTSGINKLNLFRLWRLKLNVMFMLPEVHIDAGSIIE